MRGANRLIAGAATDAHDVARFASERCEWVRFLAEEIEVDVPVLEAAIALLSIKSGRARGPSGDL